MKKMYSKIILACVLTSLFNLAKAQFSGPFAVANWGTVQISCDGIVNTANAPTSILLVSGDDQSGNSGVIDFTITVPQSGNISFNWDYSTSDGPIYDYPLYVINGIDYPFDTYDDQGDVEQSGSQTCIHVEQGDVFALRMYTADNSFGAADVEISAFSFAADATITATSTNLCEGYPLTLTTNAGAGTYTWTGGVSNGVSFNAPGINTTYSVLSIDNNCSMASIDITVLPSPTLVLSGYSNPVCSGIPITITVTGAESYTNTLGGVVNTNTVTINPLATTAFTVYGYGDGCTAQLTETLEVIQSPNVSLSAPSMICAGQSATLVASGADSYAWNTLAQTSSITLLPTMTSTLSVTGYSSNGCFAIVVHTLVVNALPAVSIIPSKTVVCVGETIQLSGGGATSYTWNTSQTTASISITPSTTIISYSVFGIDNNGCGDGETFLLVANPCTGIDQIANDASMIRIYPNPASSSFSIDGLKSVGSILITDMNARTVSQIEASDSDGKINIEHITSGIYFVKVLFADGSASSFNKLVISR